MTCGPVQTPSANPLMSRERAPSFCPSSSRHLHIRRRAAAASRKASRGVPLPLDAVSTNCREFAARLTAEVVDWARPAQPLHFASMTRTAPTRRQEARGEPRLHSRAMHPAGYAFLPKYPASRGRRALPRGASPVSVLRRGSPRPQPLMLVSARASAIARRRRGVHTKLRELPQRAADSRARARACGRDRRRRSSSW